jgi:hypothetical protein
VANQARTRDSGGNTPGQGGATPDEPTGTCTTGPGDRVEAEPPVDEMGIPVPSAAKPNPRGGTLTTAAEDLTEPGEDANFPEPAKPISRGSRPSQGQNRAP